MAVVFHWWDKGPFSLRGKLSKSKLGAGVSELSEVWLHTRAVLSQ